MNDNDDHIPISFRVFGSSMSGHSRTYVPAVWFEVSADLPSDLGWWVNVANRMPVIGTSSFFALFCISLVAVAVSGVFLVKRRSRTHQITSSESGSKETDS